MTGTLLVCATTHTQAHAQGSAAALGDPMQGTTAMIAQVGFDAQQPANSDAVDERDPDPMQVVGIGVKAGLAHVPSMQFNSPITGEVGTNGISSRTGLQVAMPINLGDGSGLAFDLEPFLFRYSHTDQTTGETDNSMEVGGYMGPAVRFHMHHFYLSLGIGVKGGYIMDPRVEMGVDVFGRVPLTATYYVSDGVGITLEFAAAYGMTGVKAAPEDSALVSSLGELGASAPSAAMDAATVQFGSGFAFDGTLGLRFP